MPGQFDAGVQHRSMGEPPELADLAARIISRTGKLAARCHIDLDDVWQFCSVAHALLATPRICIRPGPKVTAGVARQNSQDRPTQPPLNAVSACDSTGSGAA